MTVICSGEYNVIIWTKQPLIGTAKHFSVVIINFGGEKTLAKFEELIANFQSFLPQIYRIFVFL